MKEKIKEWFGILGALFKRGASEVMDAAEETALFAYKERNKEQMHELTESGRKIKPCEVDGCKCYYLTADGRKGIKAYCVKYCVTFALPPFQIKGDCIKIV
jgi:hypothetical protein